MEPIKLFFINLQLPLINSFNIIYNKLELIVNIFHYLSGKFFLFKHVTNICSQQFKSISDDQNQSERLHAQCCKDSIFCPKRGGWWGSTIADGISDIRRKLTKNAVISEALMLRTTELNHQRMGRLMFLQWRLSIISFDRK